MKRVVSFILIISLILTICFVGTACSGGTYTLMMYIDGSDLEYENMSVSKDLKEIINSNLNTSRVNLLLFLGGSEMWYQDIPRKVNSTLLLSEKDNNKSFKLIKKSKTQENMGKADTLSNFLNFSQKKYPADHYGLIYLGHGYGSAKGLGKDKNFQNDSLELSELKQALGATSFGKKNKLDFVGLDACMMASVETAEALCPFAEYMIASQESEPVDDWDYSFLEKFNSTFDAREIAKEISDKYHNHYKKQKSDSFNPDLTISCVDLSKTDTICKALDSLCSAMEKSLSGEYSERARERASLKTFGGIAEGSKEENTDMVDINELAKVSSKAFKKESDLLKSSVQEAIALNDTNINDACGLSIYYPYNGKSFFKRQGSKTYKTFDRAKNYVSYIDSFTSHWAKPEQNREMILEKNITLEDGKLTVKLSDTQKKNFSKAYLNILESRRDSENKPVYVAVIRNRSISPDKDGNITVTSSEKIPVFNNTPYFCMEEVHKDKNRTVYITRSCQISCGDSGELASYTFIQKGTNDKLSLTAIDNCQDKFDTKEKISYIGKKTLNLDEWDHGLELTVCYAPSYDKKGILLPFDQWDSGIRNLFDFFKTPSSILKNQIMTPINELSGHEDKYCFQLEIEDTSGKKYITDIKNINKKTTPNKHKISTEKGTLTFTLYNNFAELSEYDGNDLNLKIPAKAGGLPVKIIANDAFSKLSDHNHKIDTLEITNPETNIIPNDYEVLSTFNNIKKVILPKGQKEIPEYMFKGAEDLEEVVIPDSVERIGKFAFMTLDKLKKLVLPKNVKHIEEGAFYKTNTTNAVSFKKGNSHYKIKDRMLLSKDGKKLLAYFPVGISTLDTLKVPNGVEEIASYVHCNSYDNALKSIKLPNTVKKIGCLSFSEEEFTELTIPDSVTEIGHNAFESRETIKSLSIGKGLSKIGATIISNSKFEKLKVSPKNPYYSASENYLYNKAKDYDLTLKLISGADFLKENHNLYNIYNKTTKKLNLKEYTKSDEKNDTRKYNGKSFCTKLTQKKEYNNYKPSDSIVLNGKKFSVYCNYSKLLENSFKPEKDDSLKKIKFGESIFQWLSGKKGNRFCVEVKNYNRLSDKLPLKDCGIEQFSLDRGGQKNNNKMLSFKYKKLNEKSTYEDALKYLGKPAKISLYTNVAYKTDTIDLEYYVLSEQDYSYHFRTNLSFVYSQEKKTYYLDEFSLETE